MLLFRILIGLFLYIVISTPINAQTIAGYKDSYFQVSNNRDSKVCEYDKKYLEKWCIEVPKDSRGLYVGFKQLLVYSNESIQMIDTIRKSTKWTLPLTNVRKLNIKFPAIITFSNDSTLKGFDYFTGYELWTKSSNYKNMFQAGVDVWGVSNNVIEKLDVFSSEITAKIPVKGNITNIKGDSLYLFIEKDGELFHLNVVDEIGRAHV